MEGGVYTSPVSLALTPAAIGNIFPIMVSTIHKALAVAVTMLLKPLVHILLRNGVSYGDFAEMAKMAYVDVASDEFRNGRPMTISRIAALTGLTRKEAKRLHELDRDSNAESYGRYNRAIRVISGWLNDVEFQDKKGLPSVLPMEGQSRSFSALVKNTVATFRPGQCSPCWKLPKPYPLKSRKCV